MEHELKNLFCHACIFQFDTKLLFSHHLSFVHGIEIETKREPIEFKEEEKVTFLTSRRAQGQKTLHEKLFKCDNCDKCFARKDVLERHKGTVHEGKRPFKCSICNTGFSRKDFLTRHISTVL